MNLLQIELIVFFGTATLLFLLINIWTKGFLVQYMKVRGARDRGQMVMINSASDVYFRSGKLDGSWLLFKDRNKNKKRLDITGATPRRIFGYPVWETDEEKNAILTNRTVKGLFGKTFEIKDEESPNLLVRTWENREGHDAVKTDNLYERVLTAPVITDNKQLIILIACIIAAIASIYCAYKLGSLEKAIKALSTITQTAQQVIIA